MHHGATVLADVRGLWCGVDVMASWLYPPAFVEMFRCDCCETDYGEDDLTEYERDKWACDDCIIKMIREQAEMREMADDDKAHAEMDRRNGL